MNTKNIWIAVTAVLIIGAYYFGSMSENTPQPIQPLIVAPVASGQSSQATDTVSADFDLQTKCSDESVKLFKLLGYSYDSKNPVDFFSDHWNKSMNKCFILITSNNYSIGGAISIELLDVAESKAYGEFFAISPNVDKPGQCSIYKTGDDSDKNNTQTCNSESEFDSIVRPYMNN